MIANFESAKNYDGEGEGKIFGNVARLFHRIDIFDEAPGFSRLLVCVMRMRTVEVADNSEPVFSGTPAYIASFRLFLNLQHSGSEDGDLKS